jgi:mono/diheme cytochrome c family protein
VLDDWLASNLTGEHNVGLGRWSEQDLATFLKTGANQHASAFGAMTSVISNSTQAMNDTDVTAMSRYLKSLPSAGGNGGAQYAYDPKTTKVSLSRPANDPGARVYTAYCMHRHGVDGRGFASMLAPLAGNPNVLEKDASSLITVTLSGTGDLVIQGIPAAYPMPKYSPVLNDQQVADMLTFVRAGWNNNAPAVTPLKLRSYARRRRLRDKGGSVFGWCRPENMRIPKERHEPRSSVSPLCCISVKNKVEDYCHLKITRLSLTIGFVNFVSISDGAELRSRLSVTDLIVDHDQHCMAWTTAVSAIVGRFAVAKVIGDGLLQAVAYCVARTSGPWCARHRAVGGGRAVCAIYDLTACTQTAGPDTQQDICLELR